MTETKLPLEPLQSETVGELIRATGPCITLVLPPYRPGEPEQTAAALLKTSLQDAQRQLAARKIAEPQIRSLLEPLERLVSDNESLAGSHAGRVIFRSPAIFRQIELPERVELHESPAGASLVIGAGFHIRPILTAAALPEDIYVLDVTKRDVTLLRCAEGRTHRVELPKGTPQTLSDALAFDAPDHDLVNRSASGPSTGSMQGVRFDRFGPRNTARVSGGFLQSCRSRRERDPALQPGAPAVGWRGGRRCDVPKQQHLSAPAAPEHSGWPKRPDEPNRAITARQ